MDVYGVKYVQYQLSHYETMIVKYYVTEVQNCIIAVNGLNYVGYNPVLSNKPYLLKRRRHVC